MAKISLSPYKFNVKVYTDDETNHFPDLDNLVTKDGEFITFTDILSKFFEDKLTPSCINNRTDTFLHSNLVGHDEEHIKVFQNTLTKNGAETADQYYGLIKVGKYGSSGMITDITTARTIHVKTPSETDAIPLYFNILIPKSRNVGLLFMQKHGLIGMKTALIDELYRFVKIVNPDYELTVSNFAPYEIVKKSLEESTIPRIRLFRYSAPIDNDDLAVLPNEGIVDNELPINNWDKIEKILTLSPRGMGVVKQRLLDSLNQRMAIGDIVEFETEEYDQVKVELKTHNSTKVLDIDRLNKFNCSIDVTKEAGLNENGHPIFELLHKEGDKHVLEYSKHLGIEQSNQSRPNR